MELSFADAAAKVGVAMEEDKVRDATSAKEDELTGDVSRERFIVAHAAGTAFDAEAPAISCDRDGIVACCW